MLDDGKVCPVHLFSIRAFTSSRATTCEIHLPVPMILHLFRCLACDPLPKSNLQICSRAEDPPITRDNHALHPRINIEHGVRRLYLGAHCLGEGIVLARAI